MTENVFCPFLRLALGLGLGPFKTFLDEIFIMKKCFDMTGGIELMDLILLHITFTCLACSKRG